MSKDQSWIADLLNGYAAVQNNGVALPARKTINFIPGLSAPVDNPNNNSTDVPLGGGSSVPPQFIIGLFTYQPNAARQVVNVDGYGVSGDGGKGTYVWNPTYSGAGDGGITIVPSYFGYTTGAWQRIVHQGEGYNAQWYGSMSTTVATNNSAAIIAAIAAATGVQDTPTVYVPPATAGGEYSLLTPIPVNNFVGNIVGASGRMAPLSSGTILRPQFMGPVFYNTSVSPSANITQDGSSGFYGLPLTGLATTPHIRLNRTYRGSIKGLSAFTIEFWIKATTGAQGTLFSSAGRRAPYDPIDRSLFIRLFSNNTVQCGLTTTGNPATLNNPFGVSSTTSVLPSGTRTKVAFSYDGAFLRTYVNGVYVAASQTACTGTIAQTDFEDFWLGASTSDWLGGVTSSVAVCSLYEVRISNSARYTDNTGGTSYSLAKITTTDANTKIWLAFDPANDWTTRGLVQAFTQDGANAVPGNTPIWMPVSGLAGGTQQTGSHFQKFQVVGQYQGITAVHGNLVPRIRVSDFSVYASVLATIEDNSYLAEVIDNDYHAPSPSLGGDCYAVGLVAVANWMLYARGNVVTGGYPYAMVGAEGSATWANNYIIGNSSRGSWYCRASGGSLSDHTFLNCFPGDEGGSQLDHAMAFVGGPFNVRIVGGSIQMTTNGTNPLVYIDGGHSGASPGSIAIGANFQGLGTNPNIVSRYPMTRPITVAGGEPNTLLSGGIANPWTNATSPAFIVVQEQESTSTSVSFVADADLSVNVNAYMYGTINVRDPSKLLSVNGRSLILPLSEFGRSRIVYNYTAKDVVVRGVIGTGDTLTAGKVAEFQCKGSRWFMIGTATTIPLVVPATLPGCVLHLDPAVGVTTAGGAVSAWTDRSTFANNAAQATGGLQPTSLAASTHLGGVPSISFSGTQWLSIANAASLQLVGDYTMAMVIYPTSVVSLELLSKGVAGEFSTLYGAAGVQCNRNGNAAGFSQYTLMANAAYVVTVASKSGEFQWTLNGVLGTNGGRPYAATPTTTTNPVRIGLRDDSISSYTGEVGDIFLANVALSQTDLFSLIATLSAKYSIPVALPA